MNILLLIGPLLILSFSARAFLVSIPENLKKEKAQLMVVIHGCLQSPESMAFGTGYNLVAEKLNLVIFYPQVPRGSHPVDCWSWYLPENQMPNSGQLFLVREQIQKLKKALGIEHAPTYLAGISSGGALVAGLMACYPKEFAGGAVHSGPTYGLVNNLEEGKLLLKAGPLALTKVKNRTFPCRPQEFTGKIIVIQGTADEVVNPANGKRVVEDFCSHCQVTTKMPQRLQANGLEYERIDYYLAGQLKGRFVKIFGLGHAWSGYNLNVKFADLFFGSLLNHNDSHKNLMEVPFFGAKGPSATNLIVEFLIPQP